LLQRRALKTFFLYSLLVVLACLLFQNATAQYTVRGTVLDSSRRKPNFESMTSIGPNGAGVDINELIRAFQFRKNRSTLRFQERLLQQEQDKFIDHRFNKALVRRLTKLEEADLDRFMQAYRPDFEFTAYANDYQFQLYLVACCAFSCLLVYFFFRCPLLRRPTKSCIKKQLWPIRTTTCYPPQQWKA
jgi:hypothetical protein